MTLDGVAQAPGGPEEDLEGGDSGETLFPPDGPSAELRLLGAPEASEKGAVLLRYGWAGPPPGTGLVGS